MSIVNTLNKLIQSEISDFFSGLGRPSEPTDLKELHDILQARIKDCFHTAEEMRVDDITLELSRIDELLMANIHIDELHNCIANDDLENAKSLMVDFINDETPF
jgi:hypothetical protein